MAKVVSKNDFKAMGEPLLPIITIFMFFPSFVPISIQIRDFLKILFAVFCFMVK